MAVIGDSTPMRLQLMFTNYAEGFESRPRYHVTRISFNAMILNDDCSVDHPESWSVEDQRVLDWQTRPENLQDDVHVRSALTQLTGRLCPYRNTYVSIFDKVKSDELDTQQKRIGNLPLSSFRSAMLTKHSAGDGQADGRPELLFLHDAFGGDIKSFLRWRSHDYMKLTFWKPGKSFRVFWIVQWDIVDSLCLGGSLHEATNHAGKRRRSASSHQDAMHRAADESEKFNDVRYRPVCERRKSPWVAEMTPKGNRSKIWLGSFKTGEAAARAADAAFHYYNIEDKLNFRDSPQYLEPLPLVLIDKGKENFVKKEAKRLAALAEMLPSTWDPENRFCNTSTEEFAASQPPENIGSGSDSDGVAPLTDSVSDPEINLDVQPSQKRRTPASFVPSTSYGSDLLQGIGGSSPTLERADINQHTGLKSVANCISEEATNTVFNAFTSIVWGENILVPIIPGGIAGESASDVVSVEVPDISNDLALHHEMGGETTFWAPCAYDSSEVGEPVRTGPNGDLMRDLNLFDWLLQ